jgi:TonB family protein
MRLWPILLLASAAAGQTPGQPTVYRVGNGITAPELLYKSQPEYSAEARQARLEGAVALSLVVGADGRASDIRVRRSVGMGLDENAIAAIAAWRFKPAMKGDQPVPVESTIEVSFHLYANSNWHLNRAAYLTEPGVSTPSVVRALYPAMTQDSRYATFRLEAQIDERGVPREVQVVYSSDLAWMTKSSASSASGVLWPPRRPASQLPSPPNSSSATARPLPPPIRAFASSLDGVPREVQVVSSSEPGLHDQAVRLIREWRFVAAQKAGQPVAVTAEFELSHGEALPRPIRALVKQP